MKLSVQNGCFSYRAGQPLLENISFEAEGGDVLAILGPNGAGKTTLINILSGNLSANSGEFKIFGHTSSERDAIRHLIGVEIGRASCRERVSVSV